MLQCNLAGEIRDTLGLLKLYHQSNQASPGNNLELAAPKRRKK
jgi:hypothetical protein